MKDIDKAKIELEEKDYSLVFVKNGEVILTSYEKGVKELYEIIKGDYEKYRSSSVADKVVGRGAAIIYDLVGVDSIYARVMSETALDYLKDKRIETSFSTRIPSIRNRTDTDLCPIEKLSLKSESGLDFIASLDRFFDNK